MDRKRKSSRRRRNFFINLNHVVPPHGNLIPYKTWQLSVTPLKWLNYFSYKFFYTNYAVFSFFASFPNFLSCFQLHSKENDLQNVILSEIKHSETNYNLTKKTLRCLEALLTHFTFRLKTSFIISAISLVLERSPQVLPSQRTHYLMVLQFHSIQLNLCSHWWCASPSDLKMTNFEHLNLIWKINDEKIDSQWRWCLRWWWAGKPNWRGRRTRFPIWKYLNFNPSLE